MQAQMEPPSSRSQHVNWHPQGNSNWCSPASLLGSFPTNTRGHVEGLHSSVPSEICHYQAAWNSNTKINNMFSNLERGEGGATSLLHWNESKIHHVLFEQPSCSVLIYLCQYLRYYLLGRKNIGAGRIVMDRNSQCYIPLFDVQNECGIAKLIVVSVQQLIENEYIWRGNINDKTIYIFLSQPCRMLC